MPTAIPPDAVATGTGGTSDLQYTGAGMDKVLWQPQHLMAMVTAYGVRSAAQLPLFCLPQHVRPRQRASIGVGADRMVSPLSSAPQQLPRTLCCALARSPASSSKLAVLARFVPPLLPACPIALDSVTWYATAPPAASDGTPVLRAALVPAEALSAAESADLLRRGGGAWGVRARGVLAAGHVQALVQAGGNGSGGGGASSRARRYWGEDDPASLVGAASGVTPAASPAAAAAPRAFATATLPAAAAGDGAAAPSGGPVVALACHVVPHMAAGAAAHVRVCGVFACSDGSTSVDDDDDATPHVVSLPVPLSLAPATGALSACIPTPDAAAYPLQRLAAVLVLVGHVVHSIAIRNRTFGEPKPGASAGTLQASMTSGAAVPPWDCDLRQAPPATPVTVNPLALGASPSGDAAEAAAAAGPSPVDVDDWTAGFELPVVVYGSAWTVVPAGY